MGAKVLKLFLLTLVIPALINLSGCKSVPDKPNILFICVDDLRNEAGCYGNSVIQTPNIDRLADDGILFNRHYTTVPTCGASRYSLLSGMWPVTRGDADNGACIQRMSGKPETETPETFIHHMKRNGYYTVGIGKISHHPDGYLYGYRDSVGTELELPHSWDEMLFDAGKWGTGWNAFFGYADGSNRQSRNHQVKPYEAADVDDEGYPDGLISKLALKKMKTLKEKGDPFFLAIGFFKPHLPFNAPKKYWDIYNEEDIPLAPNPAIPENVNRASLHPSGEFNSYRQGEEKASLNKPFSDEYARKLKHAYYASVSYIDAQIGKLIDELDNLGIADNTIVVVWGDHGWHLGEQLVWGKHTVFENALKSTFIMKVPGYKGIVTDKIVSTVDIYPTMMELCNINMPHETNGRSMVRLLEEPEDSGWENVAYGYFRKGISLRTDRYRVTKYFREEEPVIELFDHQTDPHETENIAADNEEIVNELMETWKKGNTGVYQ